MQETIERSRLDNHWTNGAGPSSASENGPSNLTREYQDQLQADLDRINHELDELDELELATASPAGRGAEV